MQRVIYDSKCAICNLLRGSDFRDTMVSDGAVDTVRTNTSARFRFPQMEVRRSILKAVKI